MEHPTATGRGGYTEINVDYDDGAVTVGPFVPAEEDDPYAYDQPIVFLAVGPIKLAGLQNVELTPDMVATLVRALTDAVRGADLAAVAA